jgi:anti-sigma factor RsiW
MAQRRLAAWVATMLAAGGCGLSASAAGAMDATFDAPVPLSRCTALRGTALPAALRRPGVTGRRCLVQPALRIFVLSSDPTSWPAVQNGRGPVVSLEDPVARRLWVADAGPVGVSFTSARLVVARDARGQPRAAYYTGLADRLDGTGSVEVFVTIRTGRRVCLLGVSANEAEARQIAVDEGRDCLPAVDGG